MAFVVEDGTGLANATSYVSLAEFYQYWIDRNVDVTQYPEVDRQSKLILASDHVDLFFGPYLLGYPAKTTQSLRFPRLCVYLRSKRAYAPSDAVPVEIKNAVCEYAKRELIDSVVLVPDPTRDKSGDRVLSTFKKAGPLEKRVTYSGGAPQLIPSYPKADAYLQEFVFGMGGGSMRA